MWFALITVFFLGILTGMLGTVIPKRERERESLVEGHAS